MKMSQLELVEVGGSGVLDLLCCCELSMCRDKSVVRKIYCSNKVVSNEGWTRQKFQLCGWTGKVLYKKKLQIMCSRNWVWMDVSKV